MTLQLQLENITTLNQLKDFVEIIHCEIGFFGGRHFYANGNPSAGHVNLNDITLRFNAVMYSDPADSPEKLESSERVLAHITSFENSSLRQVVNANWFSRLLTYLRQYFGNKGYHRNQIQRLLSERLEEKIQRSPQLVLPEFGIRTKEELIKKYRAFSCYGCEVDKELMDGFNYLLPKVRKGFKTNNLDIFNTALQPFYVKGGYCSFSKNAEWSSSDALLFLINQYNKPTELTKKAIIDRLLQNDEYLPIFNNMPISIGVKKVLEGV